MLRIRDLSVGYGAEPVLDQVNLEVGTGHVVSLVGPSGSGKTSVLRAVTSLLTPLKGTVDCDASATEVGFLFQDDALLPWRTVAQNVSLGLRIRDVPADDIDRRVTSWLERVGLDGLGDRYPAQLSGGQRKRAALAQVLVLEPRLLLMDEPFASLDAIVRTRLTQELVSWVEKDGLTVLLVTHDLEEAVSVSDEVFVLGQGPHAKVVANVKLALPRPRDLLQVRRHPDFSIAVTSLWQALTSTLDGRQEAS